MRKPRSTGQLVAFLILLTGILGMGFREMAQGKPVSVWGWYFLEAALFVVFNWFCCWR